MRQRRWIAAHQGGVCVPGSQRHERRRGSVRIVGDCRGGGGGGDRAGSGRRVLIFRRSVANDGHLFDKSGYPSMNVGGGAGSDTHGDIMLLFHGPLGAICCVADFVLFSLFLSRVWRVVVAMAGE